MLWKLPSTSPYQKICYPHPQQKAGAAGNRSRIASLKGQAAIHYTVKTWLKSWELIGDKTLYVYTYIEF